jgi:hypothetical protein
MITSMNAAGPEGQGDPESTTADEDWIVVENNPTSSLSIEPNSSCRRRRGLRFSESSVSYPSGVMKSVGVSGLLRSLLPLKIDATQR